VLFSLKNETAKQQQNKIVNQLITNKGQTNFAKGGDLHFWEGTSILGKWRWWEMVPFTRVS